MTSRRVVVLALLVAAGSIGDVRAQDPGSGKSATPGGEPWAVPAELLLGQPDTSLNECVAQFKELRAQVEREGLAAKAGAEKRLPRVEMCKLVTTYSAAEMKWVQFAEMNMTKCSIPNETVNQIKTVHARTAEGQKKVCAVGLGPGDLREDGPDYRYGPDYRWRGPGYRWDPPVRPNDYKFLPRFSGR